MIDTILLFLILIVLIAGLVMRYYRHKELIKWIDAIGQMIGDFLDREDN